MRALCVKVISMSQCSNCFLLLLISILSQWQLISLIWPSHGTRLWLWVQKKPHPNAVQSFCMLEAASPKEINFKGGGRELKFLVADRKWTWEVHQDHYNKNKDYLQLLLVFHMELRTSSRESRKDCGFINAVNTCVKVSANHWRQTVACSFDMLVTEITAFICATSLCRGELLKLDLLATWGQHNINIDTTL